VQGNKKTVTKAPIMNALKGEVILSIQLLTFGRIDIGISVHKLPALYLTKSLIFKIPKKIATTAKPPYKNGWTPFTPVTKTLKRLIKIAPYIKYKIKTDNENNKPPNKTFFLDFGFAVRIEIRTKVKTAKAQGFTASIAANHKIFPIVNASTPATILNYNSQ